MKLARFRHATVSRRSLSSTSDRWSCVGFGRLLHDAHVQSTNSSSCFSSSVGDVADVPQLKSGFRVDAATVFNIDATPGSALPLVASTGFVCFPPIVSLISDTQDEVQHP